MVYYISSYYITRFRAAAGSLLLGDAPERDWSPGGGAAAQAGFILYYCILYYIILHYIIQRLVYYSMLYYSIDMIMLYYIILHYPKKRSSLARLARQGRPRRGRRRGSTGGKTEDWRTRRCPRAMRTTPPMPTTRSSAPRQARRSPRGCRSGRRTGGGGGLPPCSGTAAASRASGRRGRGS